MTMSVATVIAMVLAIIIAFLLLVPSRSWMRRILGYLVLADIATSAYVVSTYAATGAVSGLVIAVFAAVGLSLAYRGIRFFLGYEKLAVRGDTSIRLIVAEVLTQAARWIRSFFRAMFNGGRVDAPEPLQVEWVRYPSEFSKIIENLRTQVAQAF